MSASNAGKPGLARALCAALIVALAFSVYYNSLDGEFVYDDHSQIIENPWITDSKYLPAIFSTHTFGFLGNKEHGRSYRPMFLAAYTAEYAAFGLEPRGWHLVNVMLHAANGVLVFFVLSGLLERFGKMAPETGPPAAFLPPLAGAAIFTAHAVNSEAVAWVGCVPELLYTLLCLCAFLLHMRAEGMRRAPKAALVILSALLFLAAMMSKEPAIALPVFVFIYGVLRGSGGLIKRLLKAVPATLPYAAALAAYFAMRTWALGGVVPGENIFPSMNGYQYLLNAMVLFVKYMRVLVLPVGLYPFQIYDPVFSLAEPGAAVAAGALAGGAALALVFRKRLPKLLLLAAAFIIIPLLPALYIPGLSIQAFAERYLYFPTIGYGLMIAIAFRAVAAGARAKGRLYAVRAAAAAVVVAAGLHSWGAVEKNTAWRNDLTLWSRSEMGPAQNLFAKLHAGAALAKRNRPLEAIAKFEEAKDIASSGARPDYMVIEGANMNLANLYAAMGMEDKAHSLYAEILAIRPFQPEANFNIAVIYQSRGLYDEAIAHYQRAAQAFKRPSDIKDALVNIGNCHLKKGMLAEASGSYEEALAISPGDAAALNNLRVVRMRMGR